MAMMVDKAVVFMNSANRAADEDQQMKKTTASEQESPVQHARARSFAKREHRGRSEARGAAQEGDDDFQRILAEWRKEYESLYSEELTHQL
ncbi:MAG: hypothetical protein ACFCVA_04105 [Gammaproteobacteria bacterium]